MTPEEIRSVALRAMHDAIQNIDDALKIVQSSGNGGAVQFRLANAKLALEDLLPTIEGD